MKNRNCKTSSYGDDQIRLSKIPVYMNGHAHDDTFDINFVMQILAIISKRIIMSVRGFVRVLNIWFLLLSVPGL